MELCGGFLSVAPYVVRPAKPRSYLNFEKKKAAGAAAARHHYRALTWLGGVRRAGGAPACYGLGGSLRDGRHATAPGVKSTKGGKLFASARRLSIWTGPIIGYFLIF
jgi:hypothetical protein